MIIDQITNSPSYYPLHPRLRTAFDFLQQTELASLSPGRHEIDGANLFAMVQQYTTKPREQAAWEAHRRYIDLQVVLSGYELVGYANINRLDQGIYDETKDYLPLHGAGDFLTLYPGNFALLLPQDAHAPGLAGASPTLVNKIVVKISVS